MLTWYAVALHISIAFGNECLSRFCGTAFSDYGNWLTEKNISTNLPSIIKRRKNTCRTDTADYRCFELHCGISLLATIIVWLSRYGISYLMQPFSSDIREFERNAIQHVQLLPVIPETCISTSFGIFSRGICCRIL